MCARSREELGVRYVLEGSVRRAGGRVRVTAQLIEAETGGHVWAERYDRGIEDIFAVQDEIIDTISGTLEPEISAAERERAHRKPPGSLGAWELYQRGMRHLLRRNREDFTAARALFRRRSPWIRRLRPRMPRLRYRRSGKSRMALPPMPRRCARNCWLCAMRDRMRWLRLPGAQRDGVGVHGVGQARDGAGRT